MNYRQLGSTGLRVSELGFGAGIVAGLFMRGTAEDQLRAAQRAIELGVNHFDTAPLYGEGASEENLGRVLNAISSNVVVATKVEYYSEHFVDFQGRTRKSIEASLRRLGRDYVDVLYLHNHIRFQEIEPNDGYESVTPNQVLRPGGIADALDRVRDDGLARHIGFTGTGDPAAVLEVLESGRFEVVQAYYSLLNPSGRIELPPSSPLHNFQQVISRGVAQDMGVVAIRVMSGGVLGGTAARQGPAGTTSSEAIHGLDRQQELSQVPALSFLSSDGGLDLSDAAIRFALSNSEISSALLGFSTVEQIEAAAGALTKGPLRESDLDRLAPLWASGFR